MRRELGRLLLGASVALISAVCASEARAACDVAHSIALDVVGSAATSGLDQLEQSVIDELDASHIGVCATEPPDPRLARVQIRAALPDWQRASIRFESAQSPALERELDVSKLPPEARALAIASATDELVRSALIDSSASDAADPPTVAPPSTPAPEADRAPLAGERSASAQPLPSIELGLGLGSSSYAGQREALEADVLARYWLRPHLPLTLRVGFAQRLARPSERGAVQAKGDVHGAFGTGWVLWSEPGMLELNGVADLELSRVAFDERATRYDEIVTPDFVESTRTPVTVTEIYPLDHGWALTAALGLEGRAHAGPTVFSLALMGLVPLVGARSDWGNQTSLDAWGAEVHAGVSLVLDSTSRQSSR